MITVDMRIERTKGSRSVIGDQGTVIEVNEVSERARIKWDTRRSRTWLAFNALKPISNEQKNQSAGS